MRLRVIYTIEEDRIRKGKVGAWRPRWWMLPLEWMTLAGIAFSFAIFSYVPIAVGEQFGPAWPKTRAAFVAIQFLDSCGAIWLFSRVWRNSREYARQGAIVASHVAAMVGLALGQAAVAMFVWVMLAKP